MTDSSPELLKLKRWMEEFVLDRRMGEELSHERLEEYEIDFSEEPAPADDQIRLWPAVRDGDSPLYGLIRSDGYDRWQVFPFSPYAFPAIPEELRVRDEPPVRVIQGWNVRQVSMKQVASSWKVAELPEDYLFIFEGWWLMVQSCTMSPEAFGDDIGPLLRHPLDPRVEYLDGERDRVDQVLGESSAAYGSLEEKKAAESTEETSYEVQEDSEEPLE